jgi:hypothetical protein
MIEDTASANHPDGTGGDGHLTRETLAQSASTKTEKGGPNT